MDVARKRKHIRFKPDPLDYALVQFEVGGEQNFTPDVVGLIIDEAPMGGCGLILNATDLLQIEQQCVVKLGRLSPLRAVVRWRYEIDGKLIRVGFEFLE